MSMGVNSIGSNQCAAVSQFVRSSSVPVGGAILRHDA